MNNILKFAALGIALALPASSAFADTISIASSSSTVLYQGYIQGTAPYNASDPKASGFASPVSLNDPTINIGTGGGVWVGPIAGSSYVSYNASQPGGIVDPNGYYTYSSSFSAVGGLYSGTLSLLADDTVAVYLNNVLQVPAGVIGNDAHCSVGQPNCNAIDTVSFLATLNPGTNTLLFVVEQTGASAQGLDFTANFAATPEPSSLILMGSGLVSGAGMLLRRRRVNA